VVPTQLVLSAIAVEAAALAAGLVLLIGHGAWFAARERRLAPRLLAARMGIVAGAVERPHDGLPVALLEGLPVVEQLRVLGEAERSVTGAQHGRLRELARRAGVLDRASRLCRSRRWKRRLRGARIYTLLGGGEEDVPRLFDDRRAEVRAEAAAWGAGHPEGEVVVRLLELLGDEATLCRFTVKDSLLRLGPAAVEPLTGFLATASGVRAAAGLEIAAALRDPRLLDAAFRLLRDEDAATRRRATDLLGALGGERAAAALMAGLHDPAAEVRAAAARALGQGHHWTAAAELAAALRDASWEVRRAAGMALRRLGAPGELLLRRMLSDEDHFAGDMARLMLDIPRSHG
jgi:hypothetical protein